MIRISYFALAMATITIACRPGTPQASKTEDASAFNLGVESLNTKICAGTKTIQRPYIPAQPSLGTFEYRYLKIERRAQLPTLIFLPGGPGNTSIDFAVDASVLNTYFPKTFNLILTDPRGVGCNDVLSRISPGFYSTANLASDIVAIVQQEHLSNYVLFGWSYGTMLATEIAVLTQNAGIPPSAIVMEGTLGKHFGDEFDPYLGFQREWGKVKANLSAPVVHALSGSPLPFNLTADQWAAFLSQWLLIRNPGQATLEQFLPALMSSDHNQQNMLKNAVIQTAAETKDDSDSASRLYSTILCSEISPSDNTDMALIAGELVGHRNPEICAGRALNHPFDSAAYQVESPIFYVQGDSDPATTIENAKYHYDHQSHGPKYFITVPGGTHYAFGSLNDCFASFWDSIAAKGADLAGVLKTCAVSPVLESK